MDFSEKNSPKSVIEVGLDGEYLYSELQLAELTVPVASYGTWVNESVFKLVVIPRNRRSTTSSISTSCRSTLCVLRVM